jgi:hypothetical protein
MATTSYIHRTSQDVAVPSPELMAWAKAINDEMPPLSPAQKARLRILLTPVREALHSEAYTRPGRRGAA